MRAINNKRLQVLLTTIGSVRELGEVAHHDWVCKKDGYGIVVSYRNGVVVAVDLGGEIFFGNRPSSDGIFGRYLLRR